jgi:formylglycine-generating enzyme required for sulfatase activity
LTITVAPVPAPPSDFTFTPEANLKHQVKAGTKVGIFSDPVGEVEPFTYELAVGAGDTDNAKFVLEETALKVGSTPLAAGVYHVRAAVIDGRNRSFAKELTITVGVNTDALNAAINAAQTLLNETEVAESANTVWAGTHYVTEKEKTAYQNAIDTAQGVANNTGATQAQIDGAITTLGTATTTFNTAKEKKGTKPRPIYDNLNFVSVPGGTVVGSDNYTYQVVATAQTGAFWAGRTVTISDFEMADTETTYEKWFEVFTWARANGYKFPTETATGWTTEPEAGFGRPGAAGAIGAEVTEENGKIPVTSISWRDAVVWCNALSEMEGLEPVYYEADGTVLREAEPPIEPVAHKEPAGAVADGEGKADRAVMDRTKNGYRLPTRAEWEWAARGGDPEVDAFNYYFAGTTVRADTLNSYLNGANTSAKRPYLTLIQEALAQYAWVYATSNSDTANMAAKPVAGKARNTLGLFDMTGNVNEFLWDRVSFETLAETVTDPEGVADPTIHSRFYCGGSPSNVPTYWGVSAVRQAPPSSSTSAYVGFRIVRKATGGQ